jgi:peptide/nickel transport system ATP-binding protein
MYAGKIVEKAPAKALFRGPRHPYTHGLLNSFPSLHGPRRTMTGIQGSPPDLRNVPSGCPFHPRCAFAMPICSTDVPPVLPLADPLGTRDVSCWLHDGQHEVPESLDRAQPEATA